MSILFNDKHIISDEKNIRKSSYDISRELILNPQKYLLFNQ